MSQRLQFCTSHVRSLAQHIRGDPDGNRVGNVGQGALALQEVGDVSRCASEQYAQCVFQLPHADFQGRDDSSRAKQLSLRLQRIELRTRSIAKQDFGNLEASFLNLVTFSRELQLFLGRAYQCVDVSYLCRYQHHGVVVARDGGQQVGIGGFDSAPEASPKVDFPNDARSDIEFRK